MSDGEGDVDEGVLEKAAEAVGPDYEEVTMLYWSGAEEEQIAERLHFRSYVKNVDDHDT